MFEIRLERSKSLKCQILFGMKILDINTDLFEIDRDCSYFHIYPVNSDNVDPDLGQIKLGTLGFVKLINPANSHKFRKNCIYISNMYIIEPFQRQGIGTYIVNQLKDFILKLENTDSIYLYSSTKAEKFWEKLGFKETGKTISAEKNKQYVYIAKKRQ